MIIYVIKNPAERPGTRALVYAKPTNDPREEAMEEADFKRWESEQPSEPESVQAPEKSIEERVAQLELDVAALKKA